MVKSAAKYESRIILSRSDTSVTANAKSILSVLTLAASNGTRIVLSIDGSDENEALETIKALFDDGFGEL